MAEKLPKNRKHPEGNEAEAGEPAEALNMEEPADIQDDVARPPVRPLRPGQFGYDRDHWP